MQLRTGAQRAITLVATLIVLSGLALVQPAAAAPPSGTPTLLSPSDGDVVTANPVLSWERLPNVTKYRVQVLNGGTSVWVADTFNNQATPPNDLPLGSLTWRVAGMNGNEVGTYATGQFTKELSSGPLLEAPADNAIIDYPSEPVVLSWQPLPGVKTYRVQVATENQFISPTTTLVETTSYTPLANWTGEQVRYWRVQGLNAADNANTQWSEVRSFQPVWRSDGTAAAPVLLSPSDGAVVTDVVLRWQPVAGAAHYQVQVSPNGDWTNNLLTLDGGGLVKGTSFSPRITFGNSSYFWRVRAADRTIANNPAPNYGPWSDEQTFTRAWLDVPTLVSPASQAVTTDLVLDWDPIPWASTYQVDVGTNINFSAGSFRSCITVHTEWSPFRYEAKGPTGQPACELRTTANLKTYTQGGRQLYWRVRGLDQPDNNVNTTVFSPYSETREFTYIPTNPTPTGPGDGGVGGPLLQVPLLEWNPIDLAEKYEVEVYSNGSRVRTLITYGTAVAPTLSHPNGAEPQYSFRVRAIDFDTREGPWSQLWYFKVAKVETGGSTISAVSPAANHATSAIPTFRWTPLEGAHRYQVELTNTANSVTTVLTDTTTSGDAALPNTSAFVPVRPLPVGSYTWRAVARSSSGIPLGSTDPVPLTITNLDVVTPIAPANCNEGGTCAPNQATPLLRWEPVPNASYYLVHLALDANFTNVQRVYATSQTSLRPTEALLDNQAGQAYHWFVQPCRAPGDCGRFDTGVHATAFAFRKSARPITLASPANGATVSDLTTFSWNAPSSNWAPDRINDDVEARSYRIQTSTVQDFSTQLESVELDQTTYTPMTSTYPEGPVYWRVQAKDGSGNFLTMSEARVVHKASPAAVPIAPTNNVTVAATPVFRWEPLRFAASYNLEVYKNGDTTWTSANRVINQNTRLTGFIPTQPLPTGTYAWRVSRADVDGKPGPWSPARVVTIAESAPTLESPVNGTVFSLPGMLLRWQPVAGASNYVVETSTSPAMASLVENQMVVGTSWATTKQHANGTIYWRVHARNSRNAVIGTSEIRSFVHDLTRPTATWTSAKAIPNGANLAWSAVAAQASGPITGFEISTYIGSTLQNTRTVSGTLRSTVISGLVNGTTYRFRIQPTDGNGLGTLSALSANVTPLAVSPFTSVDRFITRQHEDLYGRRPTSAELAAARTRLNSGTTPQALINSMWTNTLHNDVAPPVARLYSAYFQRIPDHGGVMYWIGRRRAGVKLETISENFARSNEFVTKYGQLTNRQFVTRIYVDVMKRTAEPGGLNYWTAEIDAGRRTRGQVLIGFSESAEYKQREGANVTAALLYLQMLGRSPSTAERDAVADRLRAGGALTSEFTRMLALPEYALRAT